MKLVLLLLAAFLLSESYAEFPEVCDKTSSWKCVMCVRTVKEVLDKKPKVMTEVVFPDCKKAENKVSKRAAKTCTDFAKHFKLKMTEVHLAEFDKSANQNALNVCKEMKCCSVSSPMEGQKFKNVEPVLEGNLVRAENGWNTAFNFEMIDVCLTITLTLSSGATIASHSAITFPGYEITGLLDEAGKGCAAENKGVDGSKKRNHCVTCYDMLASMKKMIKKGETLQRIVLAGARDWGFTRSGGGALSLKPYADDGEPALTGEPGNHANLVEVAKFFGNAAATIVADFPERGGFRLLFLHDKIFRTQHKRVGYCKTVADASKDKVLVHEIQGDVAPINAAELKTQKHMIDNAVVNAVTVDPYTHRPAKEFVVLVVETVNAKGCYFVVAGKDKKIINSGASKVLRAVFM